MYLYFKVLPGTPVHEALKTLSERFVSAKQAQAAFCEKIGATPDYLIDSDKRMVAVTFETGKPEGWKKFDYPYGSYYQPKVVNKAVYKEFWEVPYVKRQEWNDILGFKSATTAEDRGLVRHGGYAMQESGDMYLLEIHSACTFNREHLIEITGSEYMELKKKTEKVE